MYTRVSMVCVLELCECCSKTNEIEVRITKGVLVWQIVNVWMSMQWKSSLLELGWMIFFCTMPYVTHVLRYELWFSNFAFGISHASHYLIFPSDSFVSNYKVSVVNWTLCSFLCIHQHRCHLIHVDDTLTTI